MKKPKKILLNRNQDKFTIRWYENAIMTTNGKLGEKVVYGIEEGAKLLEWISANNWSYTVQ